MQCKGKKMLFVRYAHLCAELETRGELCRCRSKYLHPINHPFHPHFPSTSRSGPSLLIFPMSSPSCCSVVWMPVLDWTPQSCIFPVSSRFGHTGRGLASPLHSLPDPQWFGGKLSSLLPFGGKCGVWDPSETLLCLFWRNILIL